jgi:TonB family protein
MRGSGRGAAEPAGEAHERAGRRAGRMTAAFVLLLLLATDAPNDYGATPLPDPAQRARPVAEAPQDTLTRVPGAPLRLGWTHERTSMLGAFLQQSAAGDVVTRQGDVRWFGTTSQATLTYRGGRLAAVRLECANPTPALRSYAADELRREGYRRIAHEIEGDADRSEWTGPARVLLTTSAGSLVAEVSAVRSFAAVPSGEVSVNGATAIPSPPPTLSTGGTATGGLAAAATRPAGGVPGTASTDGGPIGMLPGEIDFTAPRSDSLAAPRIRAMPPPPVRPRIAVDAGLFGRVQVRAHVDTTGRVVYADIARGIPEFNSAALAWAADVRYEPYRVNGHVAPIVVLIPVVFTRVDTVARPTP